MTTTRRRPGPNDTLPCGTESARRRHQAHGETCTTCGNPTPTAARIAVLEADLTETRSYLEAAESELATTRHRLAATETELAVAETDLEAATHRMNAAEAGLAAANQQLSDTQGQLAAITKTDHGTAVVRLTAVEAERNQLAVEVRHLRAALGIRPGMRAA